MKKTFFNKFWIWSIFSIGVYTLIRIIEYISGQKGSPELIVDFLPIFLIIIFAFFDIILIKKEEKEWKKKLKH